MPPPTVALLTDFGLRDGYVGVMKAVILGIAPSAQLIDLTHEVPPQGIIAGALVLRSAVPYFPPGTIYLAVVDPGVGSARLPILALTDHAVFVGPDNGLLSPAIDSLGGPRAILALDRPEYFRQPTSRTFHGRDVFAPIAGHVAAGIRPEMLGSPVPRLNQLALPEPYRQGNQLRGEVMYVDHFGNLVTNLPAAATASFSTGQLSVTIPDVCSAPLVSAYAEVPVGAPLAIINSWGSVEIAVRDGSAAQRFAAVSGTPVILVSTDRQ